MFFFQSLFHGQISTPPQWPSISSTGAYPPTSCIFSMVLVTGSILGFFVILYYYQYLRITKLAISNGYNQALLIMGILVCMGVAMVGCNQRPNIAILHALGAFMAFLIGAAYCAMVTFQTWKTKQQHEDAFPLWFIILRGTLASLEILSVILMFVFSAQRSGNRAAATAGNVSIEAFFLNMTLHFSLKSFVLFASFLVIRMGRNGLTMFVLLHFLCRVQQSSFS